MFRSLARIARRRHHVAAHQWFGSWTIGIHFFVSRRTELPKQADDIGVVPTGLPILLQSRMAGTGPRIILLSVDLIFCSPHAAMLLHRGPVVRSHCPCPDRRQSVESGREMD